MANLFIGFPVPRAKIAEMIEGSAPPLEHIANHLPGGTDELVDDNDISADQLVKWNGTKFIGTAEPSAGIATPYDDLGFYFKTSFPTLDNLKQSTNNDAADNNIVVAGCVGEGVAIYPGPEL